MDSLNKDFIKELISKGKRENVLKMLNNYFKDKSTELSDEIVLYSAQQQRLKDSLRKGLINQMEANEEFRKIERNLLELISIDLDEADLPRWEYEIVERKGELDEIIGRVRIKERKILKCLSYHLKLITNWASIVKFSDLEKGKPIDKTYINLDFFLTPEYLSLNEEKDRSNIPISKLLAESNSHLVILGHPGAGKTTSMKKLIDGFVRKQADYNYTFPILIRFRDLNIGLDEINGYSTSNLIADKILETIGVDLEEEFPNILLDDISELIEILKSRDVEENTRNAIESDQAYRKIVSNYLSLDRIRSDIKQELDKRLKHEIIDKFNFLIILDGFDEIKSQLKQNVLDEIKNLCEYCTKSRFIITSRIGEIIEIIPDSQVFQICPLTEIQIKEFVFKWFPNRLTAEEFIKKIRESALYDTAILPLNLAHICALYERKKQIPDKSTMLYDKIINLLLEDWDAQRNIVRNSKYKEFSIYQKKEFLAELAYYLTVVLELSSFSRRDFLKAYNDICENYFLPKDEATIIALELQSHTGLFIQSGYDRYQFSHKSLQEFLAAEYIMKLPELPYWKTMVKLPSESALIVNLSSKPVLQYAKICNDVLIKLINNDTNKAKKFFISFIQRIHVERIKFKPSYLFALSSLKIYTLFYQKDPEFLVDKIWLLLKSNKAFENSIRDLQNYFEPTVIQEGRNKTKESLSIRDFYYEKVIAHSSTLMLIKLRQIPKKYEIGEHRDLLFINSTWLNIR